jgi:multidrug resistance efflux pump
VALAAAAIAIAVVVVGAPAATVGSGRTATVTRGVIQSTVSGTGNLAPANQLELNFGTSGNVTKIYVTEGQHVSTGQLLARLDDSSAKVAVAQAQADLQTAEDQQASVSSSTTSTASTSSSSAGGSTGTSSSPTSAASAAAAVDSAQLALKSAEQALTDTELRAPVPGTITSIAGTIGEAVGSGSSSSSSSSAAPSSTSGSSSAAPSTSASSSGTAGSTSTSSSGTSGFITLAQLHRLKMDVSVSEADIGKVKVGQAATVTVNAVSGLKLSGHVAAVAVLSSSS